MTLPPGFRLSFEDNPSWADREIVDDGLGAHNAPFLQDSRYSYFGIFVRDESDRIRAGLVGNCYAGWLFINLLWVEDELRRRGIGGLLVGEAERHARVFGCHSAWLDTPVGVVGFEFDGACGQASETGSLGSRFR